MERQGIRNEIMFSEFAAGSMDREISEMKVVSANDGSEMQTLTVGCLSLLSLICC